MKAPKALLFTNNPRYLPPHHHYGPMKSLKLAQKLTDAIPSSLPGLYNPWKEVCPRDLESNGPREKLLRLASHLDCDPRFILCGEAPGYQGCRHSGVAFTSERLLREGAIPRIPAPTDRLTVRRLPYSEPSATIVWKTLKQLGLEAHTILWNALQLHPFREGNVESNRTPSGAELSLGAPAMRLLVEAFPRAKVVAIGRKAELLLAQMGIATAGQVRHPANGGATAFAQGLATLANKFPAHK